MCIRDSVNDVFCHNCHHVNTSSFLETIRNILESIYNNFLYFSLYEHQHQLIQWKYSALCNSDEYLRELAQYLVQAIRIDWPSRSSSVESFEPEMNSVPDGGKSEFAPKPRFQCPNSLPRFHCMTSYHTLLHTVHITLVSYQLLDYLQIVDVLHYAFHIILEQNTNIVKFQ